jgi:hypothetical protein
VPLLGRAPATARPQLVATRKVNAKSVSRVLSAEQAEECQTRFDDERTLRALVHELEELSMAVAHAGQSALEPHAVPSTICGPASSSSAR